MRALIALLPGDGIGPEVIDEGARLLRAVGERSRHEFQLEKAAIGGAAIDATGTPLPDSTLALCRRADAVLLGAVGGPKWAPSAPVRPEQGLLGLRKELGLFANLRPVTVHPRVASESPVKAELLADVDFVVVRELTGGIYFGDSGREGDSAHDTCEYSSAEIERIARTGFESAQRRAEGGSRTPKVTSVDKANVLETSQLWREVMIQESKKYVDVELSHMYVDNCAMQLVRNPKQFDVIVTGNLFGDILSDEASMLTGSIGMLPSAALDASGKGLYEPIHGSAPDIAGKGVANPLATILSAAMMLRYSLGQEKAADRIEAAVNKVLSEGLRTADIHTPGTRKVGTGEMGDAVAAAL